MACGVERGCGLPFASTRLRATDARPTRPNTTVSGASSPIATLAKKNEAHHKTERDGSQIQTRRLMARRWRIMPPGSIRGPPVIGPQPCFPSGHANADFGLSNRACGEEVMQCSIGQVGSRLTFGRHRPCRAACRTLGGAAGTTAGIRDRRADGNSWSRVNSGGIRQFGAGDPSQIWCPLSRPQSAEHATRRRGCRPLLLGNPAVSQYGRRQALV